MVFSRPPDTADTEARARFSTPPDTADETPAEGEPAVEGEAAAAPAEQTTETPA